MIRKLETAGLGYHIKADEITESLGKIFHRAILSWNHLFILVDLTFIVQLYRWNPIASPCLSSACFARKHAQSCVGFWTAECRGGRALHSSNC